jgi:predicted glycoside hydrolase/deacetylase ChbG (UPF0249 family)
MKYLIVNGDDFGASRGINRGIIDAHERGILTSASLLVDGPWSGEAASLSRRVPRLSVGLHVHLPSEGMPLAALPRMSLDCRAELRRQFNRFQGLMGHAPSHLDSHHNTHRDPRWLPHFRAFAQEHYVWLREYSPIRCFAKFYGQWGGQSHPEQISAACLARMLAELEEGITELSCHPGYMDPDFSSSYAVERPVELESLCHPMVRQMLAEQSIRLINHREAASLVAVSRP